MQFVLFFVPCLRPGVKRVVALVAPEEREGWPWDGVCLGRPCFVLDFLNLLYMGGAVVVHQGLLRPPERQKILKKCKSSDGKTHKSFRKQRFLNERRPFFPSVPSIPIFS